MCDGSEGDLPIDMCKAHAPAASHADASAVGDGEGGSSSELSLGRRKRLTAAHALLRSARRSVDQSGWLDVELATREGAKAAKARSLRSHPAIRLVHLLRQRRDR